MSLLQQPLLGGKIRSSNGCWTCRVRRKKCAENRPACDTCTSLNITCHFEDEKPGWMDGGPRQKEMARRFKAEVKDQANQRRERKQLLEIVDQDTGMLSLEDSAYNTATSGRDGVSGSETGSVTHSHHSTELHQVSSADVASPPLDLHWFNQQVTSQERPEQNSDRELHLIMIYLDYVFPYLFPHYCPPFLTGGRGWILDILHRNKAVYYGAVSLASYFFAIVLAQDDRSHFNCMSQMARQLEVQLELGLQELQKEMRLINITNMSTSDQERRIVVVEGIIQMLFFEVATSNNDNWRLHLDGAIGVFLQILPDPGEWTRTLNGLQSPKWPFPEFELRRPWNSNQTALRFYTTAILYIDIVSSVTLGSAPRLSQYHHDIIPQCAKYERFLEPIRFDPLFTEEIFGLPNWMVRVLGDVAALESWKRAQKQSGSLSMTELVSRGLILSDVIHQGLKVTESKEPSCGTDKPPSFLEIGSIQWPPPHNQTKYQLIWLFAILSYLNVVVSGWQPSSAETRRSVSKATALLSEIPKERGARTLAWPLCICGCLCPPEDEATYRRLGQQLGGSDAFGSMKEAMKILEQVWSMRGHLDDTWDVTKCLNVLGYGVLLI